MKIAQTLEKAVIKDKELGLSDVAIGVKYGITYRQLEKSSQEDYRHNVTDVKRIKKGKLWERSRM